jgi:uncharacterized repeat protein (TIGR01451 family)
MHLLGRAAVALVAALLAVALGVGGAQLLLQARSQVGPQPAPTGQGLSGAAGTTPSPSTPATATPLVAVAASVTRDQAIALVRSLREVVRLDRIEAKLLPWSEFAPSMGVDRTGGKTPLPSSVWVVAVAGDTYPTYWGAPLGTPQQHFAWSLWGVDAVRGNIASLSVGSSGNWPPAYDSFFDHTAVAPTSTPSPVPFVPTGRVIPWSGLRATPIPAPTPPSAPAGIRPCTSDDLVARFAGWGASPGSDGPLAGALRLGNRSSSSCWLRGVPAVRLLSASGEIPAVTPPMRYDAGAGPEMFPFALLPANTPDPERVAWLTVSWSNWCGADVRPVAIVVRNAQLPEIRVAVNGIERIDGQAARMPRCDDRGGPALLAAGGFESYERPGPSPTPWVDRGTLEVIADQPLRGRPGELVHYRVTLRNTGAIPVTFDECPVFTQHIPAGTFIVPQIRWILPCAGVPRIDRGQSATFDMEILVPPDAGVGRNTLLWGMQAPGVLGASQKFEFEVLAP